jgi:hypothetical protein
MKITIQQSCTFLHTKQLHVQGLPNKDTVYLNGRLLAESQYAPSRSCDPPTCPSFTVAFLGPKENAKLVDITHAPLHVSHAAPHRKYRKIFRQSAAPSQPYQNFALKLLSKYKVTPTLSTSYLHCTPPAVHFSKPYIATSLPLSEGRAGKFRTYTALPSPSSSFIHKVSLSHPWFVFKGFMGPR